MTTDLDRLIEAVEAWQWDAVVAARIPGIRAQGDFAWKAFEGSVDAAVMLLEALLPGWNWGRMNDRMFVEHGDSVFSARGSNPARALLLATLRAYRSTREGG